MKTIILCLLSALAFGATPQEIRDGKALFEARVTVAAVEEWLPEARLQTMIFIERGWRLPAVSTSIENQDRAKACGADALRLINSRKSEAASTVAKLERKGADESLGIPPANQKSKLASEAGRAGANRAWDRVIDQIEAQVPERALGRAFTAWVDAELKQRRAAKILERMDEARTASRDRQAK